MSVILIHAGKKYLVKDTSTDFYTSFGTLSGKDLKSNQTTILSSKNVPFVKIQPTFIDLWEQLAKGPQRVILKDIGIIIAKTGLGKHSTVVDAGGGIGSLSFALANVAKLVTVYEVNPDHFKLLSQNKELLGCTNVLLKQEDIYLGIREKELSLITLDLPEPWKVTPHAEKALSWGGFLVVYLPNLHQVKQFIDSTKKTSLQVLETIELLERQWKIDQQIMRPEFEMLGHTGFLTFCRKIKN